MRGWTFRATRHLDETVALDPAYVAEAIQFRALDRPVVEEGAA